MGTTLLANGLKDHAVVFVAQPEPGLSKVIKFRADSRHKPSLLSQAVDAGRSNHVRSNGSGSLDSVAIIHQQRFRPEFHGKHDGFAFARMQASLEKPFGLRGTRVGSVADG